MKLYKITVTETYKRDIYTKADSEEAATALAKHEWQSFGYKTNPENFAGVKFNAKNVVKDRSMER